MTNESKDIPDLLHLKMSSAKEQDLANEIARLLKDGTSDLADLLDRAIALKESKDATTAKKRKPGRFKRQADCWTGILRTS